MMAIYCFGGYLFVAKSDGCLLSGWLSVGNKV